MKTQPDVQGFRYHIDSMQSDLHLLQKRPGTRHTGGFSLVELLGVSVIASILLAVAIPQFLNSPSSARHAAHEIVKAHLQQARAHAMTMNMPTAVVIPLASSGESHGARAISLFEVEGNGDSYVPLLDDQGQQRMLQRWEILPGNIHFISGRQSASSRTTIMDSTELIQIESKGLSASCQMIVFAPNGRIIRPISELNIATAQAVNRGGSLTITDKSAGKPVVDFIHVNRLTARTRNIVP